MNENLSLLPFHFKQYIMRVYIHNIIHNHLNFLNEMEVAIDFSFMWILKINLKKKLLDFTKQLQ